MNFAIYDNLPVMIHCIDEAGKLLYVNENWLANTGYSKEDIVDRESIDFLTTESREFAKKLILPLFFSHKRVRNIPFEMVRKDGSRMQVMLSASAKMNPDGSFAHSIACSMDISGIIKNPFMGNGDEDFWLVNPSNLHSRLIQIRKLIGRTQADVAQVLGVSSRTYQRLESGETQITADQMLKMCHEYDLAPTLFFTSRINSFFKRSVNILIVDDDNDIAELAAECLGDGFKITLANSGEEALKALKTEVFDVLLTDIKMPGINGIELVHQMNKLELANYPEVFLMSAYISSEVRQELDLDEDHCLLKPIDFDILRAAILKKYIS